MASSFSVEESANEEIHGATSQKTTTFIVAAVKTSNLRQVRFCFSKVVEKRTHRQNNLPLCISK
jgi:hypothetical protein